MGIRISKTTRTAGLFLSHKQAKTLLTNYITHNYMPMTDRLTFQSLIRCCQSNSKSIDDDLETSVLTVFSKDGFIYTQEVVAVVVLILDVSWKDKVELLWELFVCQGTRTMYHDDVIIGIQVVSIALSKLWEVSSPLSDIERFSAAIADQMYSKIGIELDDTLSKEQFIDLILNRFDSSRTVDSMPSLLKYLESEWIS